MVYQVDNQRKRVGQILPRELPRKERKLRGTRWAIRGEKEEEARRYQVGYQERKRIDQEIPGGQLGEESRLDATRLATKEGEQVRCHQGGYQGRRRESKKVPGRLSGEKRQEGIRWATKVEADGGRGYQVGYQGEEEEVRG